MLCVLFFFLPSIKYARIRVLMQLHNIWDNDCTMDVKRRIGKATGTLTVFQKIWKK